MAGGVTFDLSIRLGDVLTFLGFCGFGLGAYYSIKSDLRLSGFRLDLIDASIEDLQRDYANGKVQDEKINRLENDTAMMRKEIFELQRGRGYVGPEIDGEYVRAGKVK